MGYWLGGWMGDWLGGWLGYTKSTFIRTEAKMIENSIHYAIKYKE
jgi:hypothetical protein